MSQGADYSIADESGAAFLAEVNTHLAAIVSHNSGTAEPSSTQAYMLWADTTNNILKIRNAANSAWVSIFTLSTGALIGQALGTPASGVLTNCTGTFSGAVSGTTGTFSGAVSGTTGTFSGAVSGMTGTFSGAVSGTIITGSSTVRGNATAGGSTLSAVVGVATTSGDGVYGISTSGYGVYGVSTSGYGVLGYSSSAYGVYGVSTSSYGVYGLGYQHHGVVAESDTTNPAQSAFRIVPQDAQPTSGSVGDVYITSAGVLKVCTVTGWVSVGAQT